MKVVVIGGGVIGFMSALYLHRSGHDVVVVDQGTLEDGCSYGNAGLVVPSHIIPLAAPGMIAKGIRWMFNPESPFYIRPRLDWQLIRWAWRFYRSANEANVTRSTTLLRDFNLLSKKCYASLAESEAWEFEFQQKGLLLFYKTAHAEEEEGKIAKLANAHGVEARQLSVEEVQQLEPNLQLAIKGAIYYPGDAHLSPSLLMQQLKTYLRKANVTLLGNHAFQKFECSGQYIKKMIASGEQIEADAFVLTAGAWSQQLAAQLAIDIPLQAGKGYSITLSSPAPLPRIPSILAEAKVAVTPMGSQLRFAGTMEISGINDRINGRRVDGILKSIPQYLPDYTLERPALTNIWKGLRPCSPDGLPYIGRSAACPNLVIACGHAMMGLSLAPATGLLVSELINEQPTSLSLDLIKVDRFG